MDDPNAVPDPAASAPLRDLSQTLGGTSGARMSFDYVGSALDFFLLQLVNALLIAVTLGFYYAWARVKMLAFTIGAVQAGEDRLTFHGRGLDLFWGVLRAWALFVVPLIITYAFLSWQAASGEFPFVTLVVFYLLLFVFVMYSLMGSLRYRAARTTWRGIRFRFTGRFSEFGRRYTVRMLLVLVSLGLAYPFAAAWRRRYIMEHLHFGGETFGFDGEGGELFARYLLCWFLVLPTFGLSMAWYHGHQQAYFWNHTTLAGGRFESRLTGWEWLGVSLLAGFATALTFGLLAPWAYLRLHQTFFQTLTLVGADLARVQAVASDASSMGEGAADLLDVDGGMDL